MSGGADESLAQGKNFAANMPGQMGGGNVYHGAPVLAGDAMLLEGELRGQAGVGSLDASTAAVRGMQDGGRRRRNNAPARRSRKNNASMRKSRKNNASMRRSRKNNASTRRSRKNNASTRRSRKNNASMRRRRNNAPAMRKSRKNNASMRRRRNNAPAMRRRRNQMGGDGEEYLPEENTGSAPAPEPEYEGAVTPLQRRRNNMYGGSHSLLPTEYASVNQSPALISGAAAARAGTAFTSDPFANGSGSA